MDDMLNKFTVLAIYCIYFSKSTSEYAHMFANISQAHKTADISDEDIGKFASLAFKIITPSWAKTLIWVNDIDTKYKPDQDICDARLPILMSKETAKEIEELTSLLYKEKCRYDSAEQYGGQLYKETIMKNITKIEDLISEKMKKI